MLKLVVLSKSTPRRKANSATNNSLFDDEFGEIKLRQSRSLTRLSIRLRPDGKLQLSAPFLVGRHELNRFINSKRLPIRRMLNDPRRRQAYLAGQPIGKNHLLKVEPADRLEAITRPNFLIVKLPPEHKIDDKIVQDLIRTQVVKILRLQARHYLPDRLAFFAKKYGFSYDKIHLSHAATRWGSWTGRRTISLNIALMQLPHELIDYVLVHELCHSRQANHSRAFWAEVEQILPNYKTLDKQLKAYSVII